MKPYCYGYILTSKSQNKYDLEGLHQRSKIVISLQYHETRKLHNLWNYT